MKARIAAVLSKPPRHPLRWVLLGILIKGLYFGWMLLRARNSNVTSFIGSLEGDSDSYTWPIYNLIHFGRYYSDYRMPGYGAFFFLPCLMLPMNAAMNVLLFIQLVFAGWSVYLLAKVAVRLTGRTEAFYPAFFLLAFSTWGNTYDATILTESLSGSMIAAFVYGMAESLHRPSWRSALIAGVAFALLVFMKPVFLPLGLFAVPVLLWRYRSRLVVGGGLLVPLLLPFLVADSLWVVRNYNLYHRFVPLTRTLMYPAAETSHFKAMFDFLHSWGGRDIGWYADPDISWFYPHNFIRRNQRDSTSRPPFPARIYTPAFNEDSLMQVREKLSEIFIKPHRLSEDSLHRLDQQVRSSLFRYAASVKEADPFRYRVVVPFIYLKRFLWHNGRFRQVPPESPGHVKAVERLYQGWYLMTMIGGLIGFFALARKSASPMLYGMLAAVVGYTALVFPTIFRYTEMRYLMPAYPLIVLLFAAFLVRIWYGKGQTKDSLKSNDL